MESSSSSSSSLETRFQISKADLQLSVQDLLTTHSYDDVPSFPKDGVFENSSQYFHTNFKLFVANSVIPLSDQLIKCIQDETSVLYSKTSQQIDQAQQKEFSTFYVYRKFQVKKGYETPTELLITVSRTVPRTTQFSGKDKMMIKYKQLILLFDPKTKKLYKGIVTDVLDPNQVQKMNRTDSSAIIPVTQVLKIEFDTDELSQKTNYSSFRLIVPREYWFSFTSCLQALMYAQWCGSVAFPDLLLKGIATTKFPKYSAISEVEYRQAVEDEIARNLYEDDQKEVIRYALTTDCAVIQGPPGTGKSFVAFEIRKLLLKLYYLISKKPILFITKKNSTLDEQLLRDKNEGHCKVIRLGNQYDNKIKEISYEEQYAKYKNNEKNSNSDSQEAKGSQKKEEVQNNERNNRRRVKSNQFQAESIDFDQDFYEKHPESPQNNKKKRKMGEISNFLNSFQIIGMTFSGMHLNHKYIEEIQPEIIIIEEASEVMEAELIPLLGPWVKHLIQIGDHKQLKPIITNLSIESEKNFGVSLFERLITKVRIQHSSLTNQRRMHPKLSKFSQYFYQKNVGDHYKSAKTFVDHPSVKKLTHFQDFGGHASYFINHFNREEEKKGLGGDYTNEFEARFLVKVASEIFRKKQGKVAILTFYNAQLELISQLLFEELKDQSIQIKVSTVDSFQGKEADIVLLSCVRSDPTNSLFFSENRINVAMSRARLGMLVIGNLEMLRETSNEWESMIKIAKNMKCYFTTTEENQLLSTFNQYIHSIEQKMSKNKYSSNR